MSRKTTHLSCLCAIKAPNQSSLVFIQPKVCLPHLQKARQYSSVTVPLFDSSIISMLVLCVMWFGCSLAHRFLSYEPSEWEAEWVASVVRWRDRECEHLSEPRHRKQAEFSVWQAQVWANQTVLNDRPAQLFDQLSIFSRLLYVDEATGATYDRFIEPLIGILRDPLTMCGIQGTGSGRFENTESWVQAKRYLVLDFETINALPKTGKLILMDLGASTYNGWGEDAAAVGAKWFVERLERNSNRKFDHIISFEFTKRSPEQIFRDLPSNLWGRYSYFNLPVSAKLSDSNHPWNVLLSIADPSDYVIVKLDIDAPNVERALVRQLLDNATFTSVVDEFFFEHHVNVLAMHRYWGLQNDDTKLQHSYEMFHGLRERGIRAHSWP